jgi:hypothetical protein
LHALFQSKSAIFFNFFVLFTVALWGKAPAKENLTKACTFGCKVMHDDVKSGKSVPHWQGDFLYRFSIGCRLGGEAP